MLSVLDVFKIGIGPSSSHTVGPMRAAKHFVSEAQRKNLPIENARIEVTLTGSLALTGVGHATDKAVILGLMGEDPETVISSKVESCLKDVIASGVIEHKTGLRFRFQPKKDLLFRGDVIPHLHPNGLTLKVICPKNETLFEETYYSIGGGFIATKLQLENPAVDDKIGAGRSVEFPFFSGRELLNLCEQERCSIAAIVLQNEKAWRSAEATLSSIDSIWEAMSASIDRGLSTPGELPGGLKVQRRAPLLFEKLNDKTRSNEAEAVFDYLNVFAMAVNEENAAGARVVTAPTNGAAGIIPAVIKYYTRDIPASESKIQTFLITAGAIGLLFKQRASISGAEMGCQGEVGVACAMAASGLAAIWGATPEQIEHAAEIGIEHNLGLTCDPVGGLVQIPCIERNAIGAVKAANAARLALSSTGAHKVSLDQAIETMRQTGLDMNSKYKETSQGGLAVNVVEC